MTSVGVLGEAIVDLLPEGDLLRPVVGGSPANVAVGLARLGVQTHLLSATSSDGWGRRVRAHLHSQGVHLDGPVVDAPTALAVVDVDHEGQPTYRFLWEDTADGVLEGAWLVDAVARLDAIHLGSVAAVRGEAGRTLGEMVGILVEACVVTYDPNVRPDVMGPPDIAVSRMRHLAEHAHVVKTSDEDLAVLVPKRSVEAAAAQLLATHHTHLVVVTRGDGGADLHLADGHVHVAAVPPPHVVDTVGAGDTFMAGLLAGLAAAGALSHEGLEHLDEATARDAGTLAARAAGIVVGRRGADPPTLDEVR